MEALEVIFCQMYELGRNFSVDETLLRAYKIISLKVRVATKAARYGIKLYVCTDAVDEYILSTSINTDKKRENEKNKTKLQKTTKIVLGLVQ